MGIFDEDEFLSDPLELVEIEVDVQRVLNRHFTPGEQEVILLTSSKAFPCELVKYLSAKFSGVNRADIEDAVQDARLEALQQANPVTKGFYSVAVKHNLIDAQRKMRPQSIEEIDENELSYDPGDEMALAADVKRVLEENFTPFEQRVIYAHFVDGVSTREIAKLYAQRSQTTWYSWLEHTVHPLLCRELAEYAQGAAKGDEEKQAG